VCLGGQSTSKVIDRILLANFVDSLKIFGKWKIAITMAAAFVLELKIDYEPYSFGMQRSKATLYNL
jgi:hypothetical protein